MDVNKVLIVILNILEKIMLKIFYKCKNIFLLYVGSGVYLIYMFVV